MEFDFIKDWSPDDMLAFKSALDSVKLLDGWYQKEDSWVKPYMSCTEYMIMVNTSYSMYYEIKLSKSLRVIGPDIGIMARMALIHA